MRNKSVRGIAGIEGKDFPLVDRELSLWSEREESKFGMLKRIYVPHVARPALYGGSS